ncbi:cbb3-type cytochrome oxidase subunit 3 [Nocardiopsis arvandica]|uniref:Cbb3-type cytochrome oxidase subunit 3 n=1 Tax=Nocardiopsis sinuspersici TaxID=501010 RepID=A0A7Y9XC53_9ACTN|nr:cbb3-type cytochrome oxidase subunit 3 [Nocardiopsis sinuspersici]
MPVLIMVLVAAAALAVLVGVVYVVLGKGGQLARFEADYPPLALPDDRPVQAFDLGRLMLPLALWGYHVRAVDELLLRLTATLREREERIEDLEWRLSRLDPSYVPEGTGPRPGSRLPGDAHVPGREGAGADAEHGAAGPRRTAEKPEEAPGATGGGVRGADGGTREADGGMREAGDASVSGGGNR